MGKLHQVTPHVPRISLTPDEAALSTGFSRTRIFEAIRSGKLVACGGGKSTTIEMAELSRWVSSLPKRDAGAHEPATAASG